MQEGDVLVDGGDVDDPPAAARIEHELRRGLGGEERPLEVDAHDEVEARLAHVGERLADLDAGVVDQDVEAAEGLVRVAHEALGLARYADVRAQCDRLPAQLLDPGGDGARAVAAAVVVHRHVGALAREAQRDGLADAAGAAGDERSLALESHAHTAF